MCSAEPQSRLTPAQSAVVDALFDPAATLASVARDQKLTLEGLIELVETPAVRRLLHRLMEIEAIRRRLTAAAPISAALRTLTKLLDSPDSSPIELRRAATSILRSCSESGSRHSAADSGVARRSAPVPRHSVADSELDDRSAAISAVPAVWEGPAEDLESVAPRTESARDTVDSPPAFQFSPGPAVSAHHSVAGSPYPWTERRALRLVREAGLGPPPSSLPLTPWHLGTLTPSQARGPAP